LHDRTVSEKLLKIPLFGPSLINELQLLGSQQHPQNGVLSTSFSTWGTENSLVEINLERQGLITGCNIFLGSKIGKRSFVGGCIIVQQEKISRAGCSWMNMFNALQEAVHYSLIKFCFSLWYEFFVHYA
jgi:hypothetical protein